MQYRVLAEKLKEAAASVLPVTAIVAVLCLALVRVDVGLMLSFLLGSGLLILGMGLFTLGAELSMSRIGNLIGAKMTKSRKLWFILAVSFLLGVAITMAEPDLQVLAQQVPSIPNKVLIYSIAVGVDEKTLAKELGHTKPGFTLHCYAHVTEEMQKRASEVTGNALEKILGKELKPWADERTDKG